MKKISKLFLTTLLLTGIVSCGNNNNDNASKELIVNANMDKEEIAKIILANERLNNEEIKIDDILKEEETKKIKDIRKLINRKEKAGAVRDGLKFQWNDVSGNGSDSFLKLKFNLERCDEIANSASNLIDYVKNKVRVLDTWIDGKYLLHVEKNEDTIYSLDKEENHLLVCRRFINEDGLVQYDAYSKILNYEGHDLMKFIPGMRYELVNASDIEVGYFIADKSKGYWETFDYTKNAQVGFISAFKDDMIYNTIYTLSQPFISKIVVTDTAERDFFTMSGNHISLQLSGLTGVKSLEVEVESEDYIRYPDEHKDNYLVDILHGNDVYQGIDCDILLENGRRITPNSSFADGKVKYEGSYTVFVPYYDSYYGQMNLSVEGDTIEEKLNNLEHFFNEVGISSKASFNTIKNGVLFAKTDAPNFLNYYKWHGYSINNDEILNAISIEEERLNEFIQMYENVKNNPSVDSTNKKELELKAYFAPIVNSTNESIINEGNKIIVNDLKLTIDDCTLFTEGNEYKLGFALAQKDENDYINLVHIENVESDLVRYNGGEYFVVSATTEFAIPFVQPNTYTLVSYIVNSNNVRFTKPIALESTLITDFLFEENNISMNITKNEENKILITSKELMNINVEYTGELKYDSIYNFMATECYKYGTLDNSKLEKINNNSWIIVNETDVISSGTYRMNFTGIDGEGYINIEII